jgi:hypothetical protein
MLAGGALLASAAVALLLVQGEERPLPRIVPPTLPETSAAPEPEPVSPVGREEVRVEAVPDRTLPKLWWDLRVQPAPAGRPDPPWRASKTALAVSVLDPWDRPFDEVQVQAVLREGVYKPLGVSEGRGDGMEFHLPGANRLRVEASSRRGLFEPEAVEPVYADWGTVILRPKPTCGRVSGGIVAAESRTPVTEGWLAWSAGTDAAGTRRLVPLSGGGRFDLLAPAGPVELEVLAPRREPIRRTVEVGVGEWLSDLELPVPARVDASIDGRVFDDLGRPVEGAEVSLERAWRVRSAETLLTRSLVARAATDGEGRFGPIRTGSGEHLLEARMEGLPPSGLLPVRLGEGTAVVEVFLRRTGSLRVRAALPGPAHGGAFGMTLSQGGKRIGRALWSPEGAPIVRRSRCRWVFLRSGRPGGFDTVKRVEGGAEIVKAPRFWRLPARAIVRGVEQWELDPEPSDAVEALEGPDAEGFVTIEGLPWGTVDVEIDLESRSGEDELGVARCVQVFKTERRTVLVPPGGTAVVDVRFP